MCHLSLSADNGVRSESGLAAAVLFCTSLGLVYRLNFVGRASVQA